MIYLKNKEQIECMRQAGKKLAWWIRSVCNSIVGNKADNQILDIAFKAWAGDLGEDYDTVFDKVKDYGHAICISINDEIVHSKPAKRHFKWGDIITIDAGLSYKGWLADMARTVMCGGWVGENRTDGAVELLESTMAALEAAEEQCKPGNKISDISNAIWEEAKTYGLGVVTKFGGHGIGRDLHEDPHIPNDPSLIWKDVALRPGMVFCLEPMFTLGGGDVIIDSDNWRVFTQDGSLAAHAEDTILITEDGYEILTKDGTGIWRNDG